MIGREKKELTCLAQSDNILSVYCPIHRDFVIGEWGGDMDAVNHLAFYCGKCRRRIHFNNENLKQNVKSHPLPA